MSLKDKAAIITGGARGIGKEIALTFAKELTLTTYYPFGKWQSRHRGRARPTEKLEVNGGIRVGDSTGTNLGTIRWNNAISEFERLLS